MRAVYTGHEALTFSDYLDLDTGRTLTAVPGGTYDVAPAGGGRPAPALPPLFVPAATPDEDLTDLGITAIKKGVSSIDEVRERLDLPPFLKPDDGEDASPDV